MTIGDKIKLIRKHRGLTQKELGLLCGFSEHTADVRIGQYEKNKKIPREKALETLANALNVCRYALTDKSVDSYYDAIHTLFALEESYGLNPVKTDEKIYLDFEPTAFGQCTSFINYKEFLKEWYDASQRYAPVMGDSKEEIENKRKEYMLWKFEYPKNRAEIDEEQKSLLQQKEETEQFLKEINKRLEQFR